MNHDKLIPGETLHFKLCLDIPGSYDQIHIYVCLWLAHDINEYTGSITVSI